VIRKKNEITVEEKILIHKPFCKLLHFFTQEHNKLPKILVVAPLSGHYATLLRDTVSTLLQDFDVYITDWENARNVPLEEEMAFGLDSYVDYLLEFVAHLGPGVNMLAVCQPSVPVVMTAALLAEDNSPSQPHSIILMGGPIDTRINPGKVNHFAQNHTIEWYRQNLIGTVPPYYSGAGRKVCPGYILLGGFMSMNPDRHSEASQRFFQHLVQGDEEGAEQHRKFYDEYRSVMDLDAKYFLESVEHVFQKYSLPCGHMKWRYRSINLKAITKTAILTIEGERDDISPPGQTEAIHGLCSSLPFGLKKHYMQMGAGHYGIFNGRKWRELIYPQIKKFVKS
jgi:poly(3-hydroxybutyrate) depolymerase